jgi:hypothetical protein
MHTQIKRGLSYAPHRETFMCYASVPAVPVAASAALDSMQEAVIGASGSVTRRQDVRVHDFIIRPDADDADAPVLDAGTAQNLGSVNVVISFDITKQQFETGSLLMTHF